MSLNERFRKITTFIFDVDGVLTDGTILVLENGLQARRMSIRDGYALQLAVKKAYHVLVISGAAASPVVDRLNKLGITEVYMGIADKKALLQEYAAAKGLQQEELLFMGDDMPDLDAMRFAGLAACPADAVAEIKEISAYVSPVKGGEGCVREIIEKIMKLRGHWQHSEEISSR